MTNLCPSCRKRPKQKHFNARWCRACAEERRKRPKSTLTPEQRAYVLEMRGKISGRQMAEELGTSWSNVMRFARDRRLSLATLSGSRKYKIQPELVRRVCEHYQRYGLVKTIEVFPNVTVRSIVERYKIHKPRQIRWTSRQLVEIARMGGLVSYRAQARYFARPRAAAGSIKSAWIKRFGYSGGSIHGMSHWQARHLVQSECPYVTTKFWEQRRETRTFGRKLYLWVDMEQHLTADVPEFIREAIRTLAAFQRWLFRSDHPKREILRIIREREARP